jgi:hypothetical protein
MTKEQAINVMQQAINAAVTKGVYTLEDVTLILQALNLLSQENNGETNQVNIIPAESESKKTGRSLKKENVRPENEQELR